ncbi:MAG TPA: tetratricopeptide repeat protein [Lentimicrobium sp.]|nr:tetratricopeptide repeat protein [Lentimicrobium sp.]
MSVKFQRYFAHFALLIFICALTSLSCKSTNEGKENETKLSDTVSDELTLLTSAITKNPGMTTPYLQRAEYYAHKDMFNEALGDINEALEINENDPTIYLTLSEVYLYSGKTQRALDALKKAGELDPKNAMVDVKAAKVYLTMSDYSQTFAALRKALAKEPDNAEAFFLSGLANEEMGDTLKAIDSYQAAVSKNSKHYDALKQLGIIFSIRHSPLAVDYLRNAASLRPESPDPLYILGMYYQENGDPDKALGVYQEILQVDSTFKLAHYNIGYIYLVYKNEYSLAIDAFSRAIKVDPEYTDALYNRGYAKELAGMTDEARKDYQQVLRMKTNDDKAIEGLNRLDELTGK